MTEAADNLGDAIERDGDPDAPAVIDVWPSHRPNRRRCGFPES
jgi:hypothetical protein